MSAARDEFNELMRDKERRSRHPEDDHADDAQSFLNLSDDDDDATPPASRVDPPRPSMSSVRSTIPSTRYGANTGPKGVISDAQDYRDSQRSQRVSMRSTTSLTAQTSLMTVKDKGPIEKLDEEDESEFGDEDDNDFMKKWRQSRLKELQSGVRDSTIHKNSRNRRLYGALTMVDPEAYLDAVENSPPDTVVFVYIYDDYSQVSDLFERCIRTLAGKHQDTRFVKLHFADAQMEPAGVPAVIAYRGGEKFAGLVPLINELPDDAELNPTTLEAVLKRHQILR
ncbi:Phosducin-like protein [Pseudocercospora fuligena]|uniref:Phosducin-like protein n=1 Tax=Pseudocercospora fuligena TaxID=685502 RepID=A0A8H6RR36_9PEZI|nr:Phosducin-like protein [Pseudocercospora fuligena]